MGLIKTFVQPFVDLVWQGARKSNPTLDLWRQLYGGNEVRSGVSVNWKTALEVTTVLRCVSVIADGIATVPLRLFQKDDVSGRRASAKDHPLYELLADQPNDWQTSLEFREMLAFHVALCGNAFAFINRDTRGRIIELIPFEPGRVEVKREDDYSLRYFLTTLDNRRVEYPASTIWHIRGPSWNGVMGLETVRLAREAIGLSMALEQSHARLHKNGVRPSVAYSVDGDLDRPQYERLREYVTQGNGGIDNVGKPIILDRAAKVLQLAMSGVDSQHIETRRHQIEEICRGFGVMPIMVGYSDKAATYASAEQMFLAHAVHTVRPWHRRFEASIRVHLLTRDERASGLYPKFIDTELLRGAAKDRAEYYARGISAGWLLRNEAREWEELDPVEGLSEPLVPANMLIDGKLPDDVAKAVKSIVAGMIGHNGGPRLED